MKYVNNNKHKLPELNKTPNIIKSRNNKNNSNHENIFNTLGNNYNTITNNSHYQSNINNNNKNDIISNYKNNALSGIYQTPNKLIKASSFYFDLPLSSKKEIEEEMNPHLKKALHHVNYNIKYPISSQYKDKEVFVRRSILNDSFYDDMHKKFTKINKNNKLKKFKLKENIITNNYNTIATSNEEVKNASSKIRSKSISHSPNRNNPHNINNNNNNNNKVRNSINVNNNAIGETNINKLLKLKNLDINSKNMNNINNIASINKLKEIQQINQRNSIISNKPIRLSLITNNLNNNQLIAKINNLNNSKDTLSLERKSIESAAKQFPKPGNNGNKIFGTISSINKENNNQNSIIKENTNENNGFLSMILNQIDKDKYTENDLKIGKKKNLMSVFKKIRQRNNKSVKKEKDKKDNGLKLGLFAHLLKGITNNESPRNGNNPNGTGKVERIDLNDYLANVRFK